MVIPNEWADATFAVGFFRVVFFAGLAKLNDLGNKKAPVAMTRVFCFIPARTVTTLFLLAGLHVPARRLARARPHALHALRVCRLRSRASLFAIHDYVS